jgi:hypothetical protein
MPRIRAPIDSITFAEDIRLVNLLGPFLCLDLCDPDRYRLLAIVQRGNDGAGYFVGELPLLLFGFSRLELHYGVRHNSSLET